MRYRHKVINVVTPYTQGSNTVISWQESLIILDALIITQNYSNLFCYLFVTVTFNLCFLQKLSVLGFVLSKKNFHVI